MHDWGLGAACSQHFARLIGPQRDRGGQASNPARCDYIKRRTSDLCSDAMSPITPVVATLLPATGPATHGRAWVYSDGTAATLFNAGRAYSTSLSVITTLPICIALRSRSLPLSKAFTSGVRSDGLTYESFLLPTYRRNSVVSAPLAYFPPSSRLWRRSELTTKGRAAFFARFTSEFGTRRPADGRVCCAMCALDFREHAL